jgi:hypothetical protein
MASGWTLIQNVGDAAMVSERTAQNSFFQSIFIAYAVMLATVGCGSSDGTALPMTVAGSGTPYPRAPPGIDVARSKLRLRSSDKWLHQLAISVQSQDKERNVFVE